MNLNEFLVGDDGAAGPGASYVMANKPSRDWGDAMSDEENNPSSNSYDYGVPAVNRAILPTAPKAARGPDCDMSLIPDRPPFTAFLGNLAYDCEEEDILEFFKGLKVSTVRLPQDQGRLKGFGYAEFEDRQSLLNALNLNNELLKNRKLRVDVAGHQDGGRDNRDGGRGGRSGGFDTGGDPDRSDEMNWRSRDPATAGGFSGGRSSFGGDRDRGFGGDRDRGFGGDRDRGFGGDRDRGYGGNRDRGFGGDRDRGFGGDRGYDRDRGGFGGDRDRGFGGDRDRGYGGDRDRGYGGGRDGGYNRDRGYGGDSGRSYGGRDSYGDRDGGRRPFGSGYNRDSDRDGGDRYGPPRDRYERRDEDSHETSDAPKERPKLHLAPRSKPADDAPGRSSSIFGDAKPVDTSAIDRAPTKPADATPAQPPKERPSIFGAAKPVDTASKEREVEERLQKQHEEDHKKFMEERERREGGGHSRRPRRDSDHSDDHGEWERKPRERRTSSSSSGKVISPPSSNRRDSERSNPAEVFDEDKPEQSAAKSPTIKKEEVSVRPAPPPAENVWAKRMSQQNTSPPTKPSEEAPRRDDRPPAKEESDSPRDAPSQQPKDNAWTKGKPDFVPAEPPKENAWRKRSDDGQRPAHQNSQPYREDRNSDNRRPGGRGAPRRSDDSEGAWGRGSGQRGRGGRGGGRGRGEGYGRSERPHRERQERPSPKSIDDMPQYKEDKSKDFSDRNVFSLLDDEQ